MQHMPVCRLCLLMYADCQPGYGGTGCSKCVGNTYSTGGPSGSTTCSTCPGNFTVPSNGDLAISAVNCTGIYARCSMAHMTWKAMHGGVSHQQDGVCAEWCHHQADTCRTHLCVCHCGAPSAPCPHYRHYHFSRKTLPVTDELPLFFVCLMLAVCLAGYGGADCQQCTGNTFSPGGTTADCSNCSTGYVTNGNGASACTGGKFTVCVAGNNENSSTAEVSRQDYS
jgi:hypothetical protein